MKKYFDNNFVLYVVLISVLLLPLLIMAISNDIAIFMITGKTIVEGKQLYADYIDIKPPFFFQIYALIYAIFGFSEMAPRFADLIIQLLTCILLFKIFEHFSSNKFYRWLPGIIYSILYVSLSSSQTGYPESFFGIFISSILYILLVRKINNVTVIYLAVIAGLAVAMKYSFVFALFPIGIYAIFANKSQLSQKIRHSIIFVILSIIVIILTHLQIYFNETKTAFLNVLLLISKYSNNQNSTLELIRNFFSANSEFWGFHISFVVSFGVFVTLYNYIIKDFNENRNVIKFIFLILFYLLISIVIETKFSVYIFSRLLVPIVLLSSIGLIVLYEKIIYEHYFKSKLFILFFLIAVIIFSPTIKYSKSLVIAYTYFFDINKYYEFYQRDNYGYCRVTYMDITKYIKRTSLNDDKILIISNGDNILSYFLSEYNQYPFAQSMFYLGKLRIDSYRGIFLKELHKADILIINNDDGHPKISGNFESSFELINNDAEYNSIINEKFEDEVCFDNFIIYRRIIHSPKL